MFTFDHEDHLLKFEYLKNFLRITYILREDLRANDKYEDLRG